MKTELIQGDAREVKVPEGDSAPALMSTLRRKPGADTQDSMLFASGAAIPRGPNGRRLCRYCNVEVPPKRQTFCSPDCVHNWRILTDPGYVRRQVFKRDKGICALCGIDTTAVCRGAPVQHRRMGHLWHADHIKPVIEGGGECGLENYRTLCVPCHRPETAALARRRAQARRMELALPLFGDWTAERKLIEESER